MESTLSTAREFSKRFLDERGDEDLWILLQKLDMTDEEEFGRDALVTSALMLGKNGASATAAIGAIPLLEDTIPAKAIYLLAAAAVQMQNKQKLSPAVDGLVANAVKELARICIESPYSQIINTMEEQQ